MKPPRLYCSLLASALLPWTVTAQQPAPSPSSAPQELPSTLPPGVSLEPSTPAAAPAHIQTSQSDETSQSQPSGNIRLNFQGASLNDVLNYLSEAAGFVIVTDAPVTGTVNVTSRQPVNADEAVDILNTVLISKGYAAIRNGRILKIVNKNVAAKSTIPLRVGTDIRQIPPKDEIVTQILPVRYVDAAKLIDNLRPLISDSAQVSANDSSNAIIMVDTQANIRRIAEIINALDTSVAGVSSIRIFPLKFADATQLTTVITQLFSATQQGATQAGGNPGGGFGGRGGFGGFGGFGRGGPGGGGAATTSGNSARQAAAKVVAVADTQSNSVIVSAPDDLMPTIEDIITRTDTNIADVTETRLFALKQADATEMASILTSLYASSGGVNQAGQGNRGNQGGGFGGRGGFGQQNNQSAANASQSQRSLLQAEVIAVADARTNTVIVTASRDTMVEIATTIGRLDATGAKRQRVFTDKLENADADNVAAILQTMFGSQGSTSTSSQPSTSRLNQRTTQGASSDITDTMTNSTRSSSTGR
jgi:general secretion pathway protein D